jgi:hypothetical protein
MRTGRGHLVATAFWQRLDNQGMEHFTLWDDAGEPRLHGTVIVVEEGTPMRLDYEISCSPAWETRSAEIALATGDATRRLELNVDRHGHWRANGEETPAVSGLIDIDLSLTPATNLLAVRRLGLLDLPMGESRESTAAWVLFPGMTIKRLPQRYTRIAERRFAYENLVDGFTTEIEVDGMGLVVSYPPFWQRAADTTEATSPSREESVPRCGGLSE